MTDTKENSFNADLQNCDYFDTVVMYFFKDKMLIDLTFNVILSYMTMVLVTIYNYGCGAVGLWL